MDLLEMLLHLDGSVVLRYVWSVFLPADGAIVQHTVLEQHPLLTPVIRPVGSVAGWDYVDTLGVGRVDANRVNAQARCPEGPVDPPLVPLRGSVQPRHLRPVFPAVSRAEEMPVVRTSVEIGRLARVHLDGPDLPHVQTSAARPPGPPEFLRDEVLLKTVEHPYVGTTIVHVRPAAGAGPILWDILRGGMGPPNQGRRLHDDPADRSDRDGRDHPVE